jgi:4-diphosphocytidyl-2-C-methyl-D-erythritol kinase
VKLKAPAKINIGLRLLRRLDNGYHEIETFIHTLEWGDEIQLEPSEDIHLDIIVAEDAPLPDSITAIPDDSTNLAWQAAESLMELTGISGAAITIEKRIPPGAGLGGGSSNAAAVLKGMLEMHNIRLESLELSKIALQLGADVPFFLKGGYALAEGIGETLTQIEPAADLPVVLTFPAVQISTEWAYRESNCTLTRKGQYREYQSSCRGLLELCSRQEVKNDLQKTAVEAHPEIAVHIAALHESGARFVSMTGSGSAVYGLFDNEMDAVAAARDLAADGFKTVRTILQY